MAVERRILVIGDDPVTQDLLEHALSLEGFQVFTASSKASVAFHLYLSQPDLIVLDALQPGVDGGTVLQRIRERSSVPIVVVSALPEHGLKLEWLNQGADDFLAKPFNSRELQARVRALLRRVQYAVQSGSRPEAIPASCLP